jgi:hypothetical protein
MADINSSLPVTDTTDGSTGSAAPSSAQQVGGTDGVNLRALSVDSTGKVNINNISGTISLPTGAATSALQTTGNTSLATIAGSVLSQGSTTSGQTGSLTMGAVSSTAPSYSNGTTNSLSLTTAGALRVDTSDALSITRTELNDYVVSGNAFNFVSNSLTVSTAGTNLIYVTNPGGSGKTLYLANMFLASDPSSANWIQYDIYYSPTVSANGTAATINKLNPNGAASSVVSVYTGPTVTTAGTLISIYASGQNAQSNTSEYINNNPYLVIPPGKSMLIKGFAKANNTPSIQILNWFEV